MQGCISQAGFRSFLPGDLLLQVPLKSTLPSVLGVSDRDGLWSSMSTHHHLPPDLACGRTDNVPLLKATLIFLMEHYIKTWA